MCAWMAYLVMRNESSRQRENVDDKEKTCKGDREDE